MKRFLRPAVWVLIVAAVAVGIAAAAGWGFWWTFGILAVAILANGWFATLEDDMPGGFNNPDSSADPKYAVVSSWVVRCVGVLAGGFVVAMLGIHFFGSR